MIGFPVYDDFMYPDATNDTYDNLSGTLWGNHAVAIIGYDDSRRAFRIVNQWSEFWGVNGYGWISYDLIANNDWEAYVMYDSPDPLITQQYSALSGAGISTIGYLSGDFNGDGKTDIIQTWNNGGNLGIILFQSTGSNYFVAHSGTSPQGQGNVGLVPPDWNGDGKDDFVQAWNNSNLLNFFLYQSNY